MKIFINRKPVDGPWGGGNLFVKSFHEHFSKNNKVVHQLEEDIDIIFMQDPRPGNTGISINEIVNYKNYFPNSKIVHRVNECDARKNTQGVDDMLRKCSEFTDMTIFVSNWMKNYHIKKGWVCKNNQVLVNGVLKEFNKNKKINNGKVNIVTHHWSDNYLKGFDIYDKLDQFVNENKSFTFTYIGRERGTFCNTKIIKPLHDKDLMEELSKYDIYISASRYDPGPNHILESLACEIPTYVHEDGGGCVEFAGKDHVFCNFKKLIEILESKQYVNNSIETYNWNNSMLKLEGIISSSWDIND
jgi:hypothetical protein